MSRSKERMIRHQVQHTLNRFSTQVRLVSLHIKDVNGPKGGSDISVVVRTRLRGKVELAASAQRAEVLAATSSAIRKTRRQVKRTIRRQQSFERLSFSSRSLASQPGAS